MTNEEKKLYESFSKMNTQQIFDELERYNVDDFSDELDDAIHELIWNRMDEEIGIPTTPFEDSLEKWFNMLSEEEQHAFLTEDWSDLDV